jgi:simple sugar transport system permease protein
MISTFLALTLQMAIPIVFGALCGTISERGGIIMLGVEGMMLMGAFFGAYGSYISGNVWFGILLAIFVGAALGYLYCLICVRFKAHQSVVGVGLNIFASGITSVLVKSVWGTEGMSDIVPTVDTITIPILSKIPILSSIFLNQTPYIYIMVIAVAFTWFIFYLTKIGLRYRAIGDHPLAVLTSGIDVNRYRYFALSIAGALAALGGSYLSLSLNNLFVTDMTAGRGFIALAASILGGWDPLGCLYASFIFAFATAGRFYLSEVEINRYFIQMIPYISTLIILAIIGKRAKMPEALGKLVD